MAKEKFAGGAVTKKRGGALTFDADAQADKAKSRVGARKARGGSVGSDKSPFSSAGGGKASSSPFSSACRKG